MDEFAFLSNNLADEFMASVFPTLSSSEESKLILVSTPNGLNSFYKIWKEAEEGINNFVNVRGWWNEIHDQAWADKQHKLLGDVRYRAEIECVSYDTKITIRDANKSRQISIGEAFDQGMRNKSVLTPFGFVPFDFVSKKHGDALKVTFDNTVLKCALNHKVQLFNGTFVEAKSLKVGDIVSPRHRVVSVELIGSMDLFDLVNVANPNHSYYTNGLVSHNCEFMGSAQTLIDGVKVSQMPFIKPKSENNGLNIFVPPNKSHSYIMTVDVARGRGLDYSAFIIFDVTKMPYEIVATFKNNKISPVEYPTLINMVARRYNDCQILIENNDLGESIGNELWYTHEYAEVLWTKDSKISGSGIIGVKTTKGLKTKGCSNIKEIIDNDQLIINDYRILEELSVYVLGKGGVYSAQDTSINDDLCSCLFLFGWLTEQEYFKNMTDINTNAVLSERFKKQLETENYIPFGFKDDGINEHEYTKLNQDQIELLS